MVTAGNSRYRWMLLSALVLALILAGTPAQSQVSEWSLEDRPVPRAQQPLTGKSLFPAPFVDLMPILGNLGAEIDLGRKQGNVGSLIDAALLLHKAELLTGNFGAHQRQGPPPEEATQMAYNQKDPEALARSFKIWSSSRKGPTDSIQAQDTQDKINKTRQERQDMMYKPRCKVIFQNRTGSPLSISLNERPLGTIAPNEAHEVPDLLAGHQYIMAHNQSLQWGPRRVFVGPGETVSLEALRLEVVPLELNLSGHQLFEELFGPGKLSLQLLE